MKVGAGAEAEAEVGEVRRRLHFRPALLFGSGPARRRGISIPLTAIILTAALIAITSAVATGSMIYISAAGRGFKDVTFSPALILHETIESIYLSNPGTSATVTLKNELGPITSSPANSSTTISFPYSLPAAAPGYALPDPAGIVSSVKVGGALSLNGVNGYVEVPHSTSLAMNKAVSICAWVVPYPSQTMIRKNPKDYLFEWGAGSSNNPGTTPQWFLLTSAGASYIYGNSALEQGKWYFVCGVYDADKQIQEIYVNGNVFPTSGTRSWGAINNAASYLRIGNWGSEIFNGTIDDVLIFSRALNGTEVSYLYQYRSPMNSSGLVGWWRFDEGVPGTAIDSSGMGNNGTDHNSARALYGPSEITYNVKMNQYTIPAGTCRVTVSKNTDGSLELEAVAG